jgi:hypothetical protein
MMIWDCNELLYYVLISSAIDTQENWKPIAII